MARAGEGGVDRDGPGLGKQGRTVDPRQGGGQRFQLG